MFSPKVLESGGDRQLTKKRKYKKKKSSHCAQLLFCHATNMHTIIYNNKDPNTTQSSHTTTHYCLSIHSTIGSDISPYQTKTTHTLP